VAQSDHKGSTLSALFTGGRMMEAGRWGLEPFASLRYARLDEKGFTEKGAESANLVVEPRTTDWLGSDVGMRFTRSFVGEHSSLTPELRLSWNHDFAIDNRELVAGFEGDPSIFSIDGQDINRDGGTLGAGFVYQTTSGWKASARFDRSQRGDFRANSFALRLGSAF
jgi:outer membrane autotransporter protein